MAYIFKVTIGSNNIWTGFKCLCTILREQLENQQYSFSFSQKKERVFHSHIWERHFKVTQGHTHLHSQLPTQQSTISQGQQKSSIPYPSQANRRGIL